MKFSSFCWSVCATMLVAGAARADDADRGFASFDDSPRFMLYVHKQVGSARHKSTGPSFGFAVDRSSIKTARVFDLRVAPFDGNAISLNGLQLTGGKQQGLGYSGSYGEGASWDNPWLWFAAALGAALGISCATDNWPCEGGSYDSNGNYQAPE